jgi:hypothetical protein
MSMKFLVFWFASSRREQCRWAPAWAATYCCKEEAFLNISWPPPFWCKLILYTQVAIPSQILYESHCMASCISDSI